MNKMVEFLSKSNKNLDETSRVFGDIIHFSKRLVQKAKFCDKELELLVISKYQENKQTNNVAGPPLETDM